MSEPSKACSMCGEVKPLSSFSTDRRRKDGRQARCLVCHRAYQVEWKQRNPERYRELRRQEYAQRKGKIATWRAANRDRIKQWDRDRRARMTKAEREAYQEKHRSASQRYREKNRELTNARIRKWAQEHPDRVSDGVHRRRARIHGNGAHEVFTREEIGERDHWICGICGDPINATLRYPDRMSQSLDHVTPLSRGGAHIRSNSRIAHWICNVRRNARIDSSEDA